MKNKKARQTAGLYVKPGQRRYITDGDGPGPDQPGRSPEATLRQAPEGFLNVAPQTRLVQTVAQAVDENVHVGDGRGHIVPGPGFECADRVGDGRAFGKHDDRHGSAHALHAAQHVHAVSLQAEQNQIRMKIGRASCRERV